MSSTLLPFTTNGGIEFADGQTITGPYVLPVASDTVLGGVKVDGVSILADVDGVLSVPDGTLPPYRGFYVVVNRFYNETNSINQLIFSNSSTAIGFGNATTDTDDDNFRATGLDGDIVVMLNLWGVSQTVGLPIEDLKQVAELFIDEVLFDGVTPVTNSTDAAVRLDAARSIVFAPVAADLIPDGVFLFYVSSNQFPLIDTLITGGTGTGFRIDGIQYNMSNNTLQVGGWTNGNGYTQGDTMTILGTNILDALNNPLATPANDVLVTLTEVSGGQINNFTLTGTLPRPTETWPTNSISDGGNDIYDGGNEIITSFDGPVPYAGGIPQTGTASEDYWGPGSDYVVNYNNSTWAMIVFGTSVTQTGYGGETGFDSNGVKEAQALIGGAGGISLGNFVFNASTMTATDDDIFIKANDDLYLDALGDDISLRADDDLRIKTGYDFVDDDAESEWRFTNDGDINFPDGTTQSTAWTGTAPTPTQIFDGSTIVSTTGGRAEISVAGQNWQFTDTGNLQLPGTTYAPTSPIAIRGDYGIVLHPSHNTGGVGPELSISYNDGIEITPLTNDYLVGGTTAAPLYVQGAYSTTAGVLPGSVFITPGRNTTDATYGNVTIGQNGGGIVKLLGDQVRLGNINALSINGGNPGDVLSTDGSSGLSWVAQSGGGTAIPDGTVDGQVLVWNDATSQWIAAPNFNVWDLPQATSDAAYVTVATAAGYSPGVGARYFNTTVNSMRVYNGTIWNDVGSVSAPTTVAALGTRPAGSRAFINDSLTSAIGNFGSVIQDGGTNIVPVWSDGNMWYIG